PCRPRPRVFFRPRARWPGSLHAGHARKPRRIPDHRRAPSARRPWRPPAYRDQLSSSLIPRPEAPRASQPPAARRVRARATLSLNPRLGCKAPRSDTWMSAAGRLVWSTPPLRHPATRRPTRSCEARERLTLLRMARDTLMSACGGNGTEPSAHAAIRLSLHSAMLAARIVSRKVNIGAHHRMRKFEALSALLRKAGDRIGWSWIGMAFSAAVVAGSLFVLYELLRHIDIERVFAAIHATPTRSVVTASLFVAAGYITMTLYDYFALRTIGRREVPYRTAAFAAFTSYTIGHNLGATVLTGGAVRLRIYSAWGLGVVDVAKIAFITGLTFWL